VAARSKARKRALDVLFEAEARGDSALATLQRRQALAEPPIAPYTAELVEGVTTHRDAIDDVIANFAEGWTLERMPAVDRQALRIAVYELLWRDDIPDAVAIDEAVTLAKDLSTDDSPRFVNGLLAAVARDRPSVRVDDPTDLGGQDAPTDELLGE
jgi:N utilization substance protein B